MNATQVENLLREIRDSLHRIEAQLTPPSPGEDDDMLEPSVPVYEADWRADPAANARLRMGPSRG